MRSTMLVAIPTSRQNRRNHQYSERRARPMKSTYFRRQTRTASPKPMSPSRTEVTSPTPHGKEHQAGRCSAQRRLQKLTPQPLDGPPPVFYVSSMRNIGANFAD